MKKLFFCIITLFLFSCNEIKNKPDTLYVDTVTCSNSLSKELVYIRVCNSREARECFYLIEYKGTFNAGDRVKLVKDE
jgi:hypothetical protein